MAKPLGTSRHYSSRSAYSLTSVLSSSSSTFRSLVSSKNVKHMALPKFLREHPGHPRPSLSLPFGPEEETSGGDEWGQSLHNAEEMSLLSSHFQSMRPRAIFSRPGSMRPFKLESDFALEIESYRRKEARIDQVLASLSSAETSEVLFRIKEESFTRDELRRLHEGNEVSRKLMQVYLKSLNRANRKHTDVQSVKIFSLSFTQAIFSKGRASSLHSKSDPLKYDLLLFPIFVGYWTLLVVNSRDHSVLYLDPLKKYSYMDGLLVALLQFLKGELVHHLHKRIEHTAWRDIFYRENTEKTRFTNSESPMYVLKHAECYSKGEHRDLTCDDLQHYGATVARAVITLGLEPAV